jgi:hypothetical protein
MPSHSGPRGSFARFHRRKTLLHLTGLHLVAARRGDGLRQEFLEFLVMRDALCAANVEEIGIHLAEHFSQAGPNPVGAVGDGTREDVLPFRNSGQGVAPPTKSKRPDLRRSV